MGRAKEWMMELQEQADDRHLAKLLGISYEDLVELEWKIDTNESSDGLIYNYRVEFSEESPKEILRKIERLEDGCRVYMDPWEMDAEYDYINDQFDAITESKSDLKTFFSELEQLKELSRLQKEGEKLKTILNRQIFIGVIGSMETFLSDVFMKLVFDDKSYYESFVRTHPDFKTRKFELREIFDQQNQLDLIVKKVILDTIFHNLPTVSKMFRDTFNISFPKIEDMYKHVLIRHDLVHRNGKTKDGDNVKILDKNIDVLISDTKSFIEVIANELRLNIE
jgi:hypothetical protein